MSLLLLYELLLSGWICCDVFVNTNQHWPTAGVCGWTCLCAYMYAEWEQGHSWGLGFLSEHHLQAFLHLILNPPLYSLSVSGSSTPPASWSGTCLFFASYVSLFLPSIWLLPIVLARLNPRTDIAETNRATSTSWLLRPHRTVFTRHLNLQNLPFPDHQLRMHTRHVHFWYLTGALRKIMALPVGISSSGSVSFQLINISHHISLSSSSEEMMQNESRQIKTELCVVIKSAIALPFSHLNTTNTARPHSGSLLPPVAAILHELWLL